MSISTPGSFPNTLRRRFPTSPPNNEIISPIDIQKCLCEFGDELEKLSNEVMQLGRAFGLFQSIKTLRNQLPVIETAILLNAASLHPDLYHSIPDLTSLADDHDYEMLPSSLEELVTRFHKFQDKLDEFPEPTIEGTRLSQQLSSFIRNLQYHKHCVNYYKGRLNTIPLQEYVHEISRTLASELRDLRSVLVELTTTGVPAIRYKQKRMSEIFIGISTVATLFSGVTASTLQISMNMNDTPLMYTVNALWLCALIFSVGATLSSLLSLIWRQAVTGSSSPSIVIQCTSSSPAVFLVLAIFTFSAGLVLFVYASHQEIFTAPLTIVATAMTFTGILGVLFGILHDKWVSYRRYIRDRRYEQPLEGALSTVTTYQKASPLDYQGDLFDGEKDRIYCESQAPKSRLLSRFQVLVRDVAIQNAVLTALRNQRSSRKPPSLSPFNIQPAKVWPHGINPATAGQNLSSPPVPVRDAHLVSSITIANRYGQVRHLRFSPTGPYLVVTCVKEDRFTTTTWSAVYDITHGTTRVADVWHEGGIIGRGTIWSPDGREILLHSDHELKVWDFSRHVLRSLQFQQTVRAVCWLNGRTILVAGNDRIQRLSKGNGCVETYILKELTIAHIAIGPTPDCLAILGQAMILSNLTSRKVQGKVIVVYDMAQRTAVYQVPVLGDVQSVQISRFGLYMLVDCLNAPFQAWEFDVNLDSSTLRLYPVLRRLTVAHPSGSSHDRYDYLATFGGIHDDFVYGVTPAGFLRVWKWDYNALNVRPVDFYSLRSEDTEPTVIQQFAWKPSSPTFATARYTSGGASVIQLWTVPE